VREINVSRAGDKALTQETPAKRGRVNRYVSCFYCFMFLEKKTTDNADNNLNTSQSHKILFKK
jgi:hypothetical protein